MGHTMNIKNLIFTILTEEQLKYYIKNRENLAIQDPQNKHGADNMFIDAVILTFWYHYFKCVMTEDPANIERHRRHWSGNTREFR